ncbi:MAG: ATP-binding protein [Candidatus Heimdallarchaeota archaeon]
MEDTKNPEEIGSLPFDSVFLDKIPAGIVVLHKRRPVFLNSKARTDFGSSAIPPSIEIFLELLDPSEIPRFLELIDSSESLPKLSEWKAQYTDGTPTWVQLRTASLDNNGTWEIVIIRDIGKTKRHLTVLESEKEQFKFLIDNAPDFLFIVKNGVIDYYNQAFLDKLDYQRNEFDKYLSMPTFFIAPEHRQKIARLILESKRKQITLPETPNVPNSEQIIENPTEFDLMKKDGTRLPVYATFKRSHTESDSIILGVLIDVSNIRLLNDMKFDFLTITQHEFRAPLATLKANFDFYVKKIEHGLQGSEKESLENRMLEIFKRNLNRMMDLIEDLNSSIALRYKGKIRCHLRGENFMPLLQRSIDEIQHLLREYRVHVSVEIPAIPHLVNLDHNKMSQAIRNILENAIHYTGHGNISIRVTRDNLQENLILVVEDDGIGFQPDQLQDVGKPFMTFHPSHSGLGLGLYLTKQIIEDHGGELTVSSSGYQKGTKVTIKLPLLIPPADRLDEVNGLEQLVRQATGAENMLERLNSIHKLGEYQGNEITLVLEALEKVILFDKDRTLRNLAGELYTRQLARKNKGR